MESFWGRVGHRRIAYGTAVSSALFSGFMGSLYMTWLNSGTKVTLSAARIGLVVTPVAVLALASLTSWVISQDALNSARLSRSKRAEASKFLRNRLIVFYSATARLLAARVLNLVAGGPGQSGGGPQ